MDENIARAYKPKPNMKYLSRASRLRLLRARCAIGELLRRMGEPREGGRMVKRYVESSL